MSGTGTHPNSQFEEICLFSVKTLNDPATDEHGRSMCGTFLKRHAFERLRYDIIENRMYLIS